MLWLGGDGVVRADLLRCITKEHQLKILGSEASQWSSGFGLYLQMEGAWLIPTWTSGLHGMLRL